MSDVSFITRFGFCLFAALHRAKIRFLQFIIPITPLSQAALQRAPRGVAFSVTREELLKHNTTDCQFGLKLQWARKHC